MVESLAKIEDQQNNMNQTEEPITISDGSHNSSESDLRCDEDQLDGI